MMIENFERLEITTMPEEIKALATEEQMATISTWING